MPRARDCRHHCPARSGGATTTMACALRAVAAWWAVAVAQCCAAWLACCATCPSDRPPCGQETAWHPTWTPTFRLQMLAPPRSASAPLEWTTSCDCVDEGGPENIGWMKSERVQQKLQKSMVAQHAQKISITTQIHTTTVASEKTAVEGSPPPLCPPLAHQISPARHEWSLQTQLNNAAALLLVCNRNACP